MLISVGMLGASLVACAGVSLTRRAQEFQSEYGNSNSGAQIRRHIIFDLYVVVSTS